MPNGKLGVALGLAVLLLVWAGAAQAGFEDRGGARALSLGSAFVAVPGDASGSYWNPAGLSFLERATVTATYVAQHMGLDEDGLAFFSGGIAYPLPNAGTFALSGGNFGTDYYSETGGLLSYAHGLRGPVPFSLGVNVKYLSKGYDFQGDEELEGDPLFSGDDGVTALDIDLGLMAKVTEQLTLGAALFHLTQPSQGIDDDDDKLNMATWFGASYDYPTESFDLMPTLAVELLGETPNDEDKVRIHAGVEARLLEDRPLALRVGFTQGPATELAMGFGFQKATDGGLAIGVDAGYLIPMGDLEAGGTLILGLNVGFGQTVEHDWAKAEGRAERETPPEDVIVETESEQPETTEVIVPEPPIEEPPPIAPPEVPQERWYTVKPGDTLSKIAGYPDIYNDPSKWDVIYKANLDRIKDPDILWPGMKLRIPPLSEARGFGLLMRHGLAQAIDSELTSGEIVSIASLQ